MATVVYDKPSDIKILPIFGFEIYGGATSIAIYQLEAEGRFSTQPVLKNHYKYGQTQIGSLLDFRITVPHNQYDSNLLLTRLEAFRTTVISVFISLGGYTPHTPLPSLSYNTPINVIGTSMDMTFARIRIAFGIEYTTLRPRLFITGKKRIKAISGIFT